MVTFRKSPEGIAEYAKLDPPYNSYPDTPEDIAYKEYMEITSDSKVHNRYITVMKRIRAPDGNEFLTYSEIIEREDGIGNIVPWEQNTTQGLYPKPVPIRELRYGENNKAIRKTKSIRRVDVGYSIPFTKENCEKLHKDCNDNRNAAQPRTQYYVEQWNENKTVTVLSYMDFINGEFDDLFSNSKITKVHNTNNSEIPLVSKV